MQSVEDLFLRLGKVRERERRVTLGAGISKTVLTFIASCVLFFVVDYIFILSRGGRIAVLLVIVAMMAAVIYRSLVAELRRVLDDDEIALRVEKRHPDLRGRLISTVQLARSGDTGAYLGSPELIEALEADTLDVSTGMNFLNVINTRGVVQFGVAAAVVVAIAVASGVRWPDYVGTLFKRIVMAEETYPTRTLLADVEVPAQVARGDAVPIRVRVDPAGYVPETGGLVQVLTKDGELVLDLVPEGPSDPTSFKAKVEKAIDDMTISVKLDDARRDNIEVRVLQRPEILGGQMRIVSPDYTGMPVRIEERIGDIGALVGSTAEIQAESSKKLSKARIVKADGETIPMVVDKEGVKFSLSSPLKIDKDTSYHFELEDVDGLGNTEPIEYSINAKPDQPPAVRLIRPNRDHTRTPNAIQPVRCLLKDEFGNRIAWIKWRIDDAQEVKEFKLEIKPENQRDRELELDFRWNLKELNLGPGQIVTYWIEADDFCTTNDFVETRRPRALRGEGGDLQPLERGYSRSQELKFNIVDGPTKWREVLDMVEQASGRLRLVREQEEKTRERTGKAIDLLGD